MRKLLLLTLLLIASKAFFSCCGLLQRPCLMGKGPRHGLLHFKQSALCEEQVGCFMPPHYEELS